MAVYDKVHSDLFLLTIALIVMLMFLGVELTIIAGSLIRIEKRISKSTSTNSTW